MSIKTRTQLVAQTATGQQASASKFEDMIDSAYNKAEDSILAGPIGLTGSIGLWVSATAPTAYTSAGSTGRIAFGLTGATGATSYMFIHTGTQWVRSIVETTF
jgi:hypothetical protein